MLHVCRSSYLWFEIVLNAVVLYVYSCACGCGCPVTLRVFLVDRACGMLYNSPIPSSAADTIRVY